MPCLLPPPVIIFSRCKIAVVDNNLIFMICKLFAENINTGEWWECSLDFPFNSQQRFFLCLPQHNENGQCLHWLNGGDVQVRSRMSCGESFGDWDGLCPLVEQDSTWKKTSHFMGRWFEIRIKPKKEKRWIIIRNGNPVSATGIG